MNLMVSWHAKVHSHLLCWQHAHIDGGVTCSDGGGAWIATKEKFQKWARCIQAMMPDLQEDIPVASKAKQRTHDMLHYKAACLPTTIVGKVSSSLLFMPHLFFSSVIRCFIMSLEELKPGGLDFFWVTKHGIEDIAPFRGTFPEICGCGFY